VNVIAALPLGLAIGVALGMLGGGGSVLALPAQVYLLGQDVHSATTASLVVVTAGALAGGLGHARDGRVCWRHAGVFAASALPGIVAGTALAEAVGGDVLLGAFAALMLAAAAATWRKAERSDASAGGGGACPSLRIGRVLVAGALVGAATGFFGVGGGFLIVPALALALGFTMPRAVGTSLAIVTASSVMGVAVHLLVGRGLDGSLTGAMTVGCVGGALAGAAVAGRVPQRVLGRSFAGLVAGVGVYLVASLALLGGPPAA
jgi:uncharacterized membrane protein YfcA